MIVSKYYNQGVAYCYYSCLSHFVLGGVRAARRVDVLAPKPEDTYLTFTNKIIINSHNQIKELRATGER